MKRNICAFFCFLIVFLGGIGLYFHHERANAKNIDSPLPEDLKNNSEITSLDFWLPSLFGLFDSNEVPVLSAKSALVYDLTDEKTIFEKNSEERLPMASITKLMTAVVALDHKKSDDRYVVPEEALVGENTIGLSSGEVFTLEELLYGMFMYSANDAAETVAINTMDRSEFISTMNKKAKAIGLENTNFTNPTGLQGDGDQYTTAYDLLVLARYVVSNYPQVIKASSTKEIVLKESSDHPEYHLYNQLNLITSYPGVKGLKDGYTPEAGLCLVTYIDYDGHKLIGIILGSENRRAEMKDLLDYSLTQQGVKPPPHE